MTILLESPPAPPAGGGAGRGDGPPPEPLPAWLAVTLVVLLAIGLTYLGMVTQIWANLSGAQLPGA